MCSQLSLLKILRFSFIPPLLTFMMCIRITGGSGTGGWQPAGTWEHLTMTLLISECKIFKGETPKSHHLDMSNVYKASYHLIRQNGTSATEPPIYLPTISARNPNLLPACHLAAFLSSRKVKGRCKQWEAFIQVSSTGSLQITCKYSKGLSRQSTSKEQNSILMSRKRGVKYFT